MKRTRTFAAIAAAAVLPLAACGDSDGDSGDETTTTSETSETSEETTEPADSETSEETSEGSETSDAAGEDGKVTSDQAGVSFEVPEGWKVVDPEEALSGGGGEAPKEIEDMAKAQGMSADQFLQQIAQQTDVIVFGEQKGNFTSNVNVVASPQMLTEAQLKSQLETINAKVEKTEEVDSPLGKVLDGTYVLPMGGQEVHGRMIVAPTDKGAAVVTVSAGSAKDSDEVAQVIIPSLGKA